MSQHASETPNGGPRMLGVAIGIPVFAEPARLETTLANLRTTAPNAEVVLLPDGPDLDTRVALARTPHLRQIGTHSAAGTAACFNRLAHATDADVIVLLESGTRPGDGWLPALLAALDAHQRHGLAGPSTNRVWNEQQVCDRDCDEGTSEQIGTAAAQRAGDRWQGLEPLYSLADFCYAVKRAVLDDLGPADERYGLGPCWEMDYNIRAARAGWRGVWAQGAYVHRPPMPARRAREERLRFQGSRRLYQDKFCGGRLRREKCEYSDHCRGDACPRFAPPTLIEIRRPAARSPARAVLPNVPLVSCLMPTRGRPELALQSVAYFQRQDWPERELIVLDDDPNDALARLLAPVMAADTRVRHVRCPVGETIGAKRNRGCELARGDIVIQWDDDDWFAPSRLRAGVAPIVAGQADITGLVTGTMLELESWRWWRVTPELHRRLFVHDVHGGTLAFRREIWRAGTRYPNASLAEDAAFLRAAVGRGARLTRVPGDGHFVYVRHGINAWRFPCGTYLDATGWIPSAEPLLPAEDRLFYAERSPAAPECARGLASPLQAGDRPLITCIMPTRDRRRFVAQAFTYFERQTWPERELVVLDDGDDPVEDLVQSDPRVRYVRLPVRRSTGAKRNLACEMARGELIAHWDDDDWMAPRRLAVQANAINASTGEGVSGLSRLAFVDPVRRRAWEYAWDTRPACWVAGGTMCYPRSLWSRHPFPDVREAEDTRFMAGLRGASVIPSTDTSMYVGLVHAGNTSPKRTSGPRWSARPFDEPKRLIGDDWAFYEKLGR